MEDACKHEVFECLTPMDRRQLGACRSRRLHTQAASLIFADRQQYFQVEEASQLALGLLVVLELLHVNYSAHTPQLAHLHDFTSAHTTQHVHHLGYWSAHTPKLVHLGTLNHASISTTASDIK